MKRFIFTLLALVFVSGIFPVTAEAKEKIKIKLASLQPRGSALMKILEEMGDEIRKETNNEVVFKWYWGGVQGDETDVLRKIRLRQLHGGGFSGHGLSEIVPAMKIMEAPFAFRNTKEFLYVHAKLKDTIDKYFEEKGYVVLGWTDLGFIHIFSKAPITSIEILREQKVWAWEDDPLAYAIFREGLGVEPIPLSLPDVMTGISTRVVDTVLSTPFMVVALRWYTNLKYMTEVPLFRAVGALIVTKETWDKISQESQIKIKKILKHGIDRVNMANREANEMGLDLLKKEGISILPVERLQYLAKSGKKARECLVGKVYSRKLLEQMLSILDDYRKNHPNSSFIRIR